MRDLLLAVIAPIIGSLGKATTQMEIQSKIRSTLGEQGELFNITIDSADKNKVLVDVKSKVLKVNCFPFEINKTDNLVPTINAKLGIVN